MTYVLIVIWALIMAFLYAMLREAYVNYKRAFGNKKLKLYVDDVRSCPDASWMLAKSFHEAIYLLEKHKFHEVSLDHDLASYYGYTEMTGRHILNWLIARKMDGLYIPKIVRMHSANPVAYETMEEDIRKYFNC